MLKRIFISIGILAAVCIGGFVVYSVAYAVGNTAGYDNGYSSGQNVGYSLGKQEGHDEGYTLGKTEGYDAGYTSGKTDGYQEGINAGLGHGYTLKDPTYMEVTTFLSQDRTNENKYIENIYVCSHFSRDVCNKAEQKGLRCAFVELRYRDGGHTIVAFNTIDKELVYFEPQSDEIVKPVVGKQFYQCIEPKPGRYYESPSYDDTIRDILVIW